MFADNTLRYNKLYTLQRINRTRENLRNIIFMTLNDINIDKNSYFVKKIGYFSILFGII
jgi:hypothetical protein